MRIIRLMELYLKKLEPLTLWLKTTYNQANDWIWRNPVYTSAIIIGVVGLITIFIVIQIIRKKPKLNRRVYKTPEERIRHFCTNYIMEANRTGEDNYVLTGRWEGDSTWLAVTPLGTRIRLIMYGKSNVLFAIAKERSKLNLAPFNSKETYGFEDLRRQFFLKSTNDRALAAAFNVALLTQLIETLSSFNNPLLTLENTSEGVVLEFSVGQILTQEHPDHYDRIFQTFFQIGGLLKKARIIQQ